MKKIIIALSTPLILAATAANATSIIKTDSSSFDIFGRAKFTAYNSEGGTGSSYMSTRLGAKGEVKDGNGESAFFKANWDMLSSSDSKSTNEDYEDTDISTRYAYVGVGFDGVGKFTFGQNDAPFYTMIIGATDVFQYDGVEGTANTYGYNWTPNLALYSNSFGKLDVQAGYQFRTEEDGDSDTGDIVDVFDGGLDTDNFTTQKNAYSAAATYEVVKNVTLHAAYAYQTFLSDAIKTNYGVGIDYSNDGLYLASVATYTKEDDGTDTASRTGYEAVATYDIGKYTVATGYAYGKQKSDVSGNDETYANATKLGLTYHMFSNVRVMTQVTHDADDGNTVYAGLNYVF